MKPFGHWIDKLQSLRDKWLADAADIDELGSYWNKEKVELLRDCSEELRCEIQEMRNELHDDQAEYGRQDDARFLKEVKGLIVEDVDLSKMAGVNSFPEHLRGPGAESLKCDSCGAPTDDPWHTSSATEKHLHQCDACHEACKSEILNQAIEKCFAESFRGPAGQPDSHSYWDGYNTAVKDCIAAISTLKGSLA